MLRKLTTAVACALVIASNAQAARLTDIEGTVLVNTGEGFQEVAGKTVVSAGDRVLVRGKGGAQIDYGSGCMIKVLANQTVVVAAGPTCTAPTPSPKKFASLKESPAAPYSPAPQPLNDGQSDNRILIVGGLIVVGSTAAVLVSGGHHDRDRSASLVAYDQDRAPSLVVTHDQDRAASLVVTEDHAIAFAFHGGENAEGSPASP